MSNLHLQHGDSWQLEDQVSRFAVLTLYRNCASTQKYFKVAPPHVGAFSHRPQDDVLGRLTEGYAIKSPSTHWRPSAAYLYILRLDGPGLAWEYLRRNPNYRFDWERCQALRREPNGDGAPRWGLRLLEDPKRDARDAEPLWIRGSSTVVMVQADDNPPDGALPFQLWRFPGFKQLTHDGKRLILTCQTVDHVLRVAISPTLSDGMAHAFAVPAGARLRERWSDTEAALACLDGGKASCTAIAAKIPGRNSLLHMHALQAIDGILAGASQRDVAEALFGLSTVAGHWDEDCDLRSRVRRLIRRARKYMMGGYQRLLCAGGV